MEGSTRCTLFIIMMTCSVLSNPVRSFRVSHRAANNPHNATAPRLGSCFEATARYDEEGADADPENLCKCSDLSKNDVTEFAEKNFNSFEGTKAILRCRSPCHNVVAKESLFTRRAYEYAGRGCYIFKPPRDYFKAQKTLDAWKLGFQFKTGSQYASTCATGFPFYKQRVVCTAWLSSEPN